MIGLLNDGRRWAAVMLLTGALGAAWIWASAVPASATSGSFRRRCSATWYWWGWWPTLDALAPGLAAFSIAVGFAHLASGDAFGSAVDLPWAIELWGARGHPSQIYEVLAGGAVLWAVLRVRLRPLPQGALFLIWVAMAAAVRLFLEAFRGDSQIAFGTLRLAQLVSLLVLLAAMAGLRMRTAIVERR